MRAINVEYLLDDEDEKRLTAITLAYRERDAKIGIHSEITEDYMFSLIVSRCGASIKEEMSLYERILCSRETIS